ncbi:MAG: SLATT domain-containing protein [Bacteroidales bacterium]|nr:SLATT domain-containing protein [Bacteroidales bacterium]
MEHNSQINILESQIRECFGRVVWSHKTQEKCADILNRRNNSIKIWQIVLSAITTTGIMISVFGEQRWIGIITALISASLFALNTYLKKYDIGQIVQKHVDCASNLWNVRESYLSLLADIKTEKLNVDEIIEKRDMLQKELFNIYKGAPRSISRAYDEATKALKSSEELTFTDKEIDIFLPKELRKSI